MEREIASAREVIVVRAFPVQSQTIAVIVLVRDETRLRRLERVRRDFVTNVSHELRTPITAIRLLVETLQKGALSSPRSPPASSHRIALEIGHMAQMVRGAPGAEHHRVGAPEQ